MRRLWLTADLSNGTIRFDPTLPPGTARHVHLNSVEVCYTSLTVVVQLLCLIHTRVCNTRFGGAARPALLLSKTSTVCANALQPNSASGFVAFLLFKLCIEPVVFIVN